MAKVALRGAAAILLFVLCSGCSTEPIYLSKEYLRHPEAGAAGQNNGCRLSIGVTDTRATRQTAGIVILRPVRVAGDDMSDWVSTGLVMLLKERGFAVFPAGPTSGASDKDLLQMKVAVQKAEIRCWKDTMSSMLLLSAGYYRDDRLLEEKSYKASLSTMCWTGSENEVNGQYVDTLVRVIDAMEADARKYCTDREAAAR